MGDKDALIELAATSKYVTTLNPEHWLELGLKGYVERIRDDEKGRARFAITPKGLRSRTLSKGDGE